jgi:hypothetical protein
MGPSRSAAARGVAWRPRARSPAAVAVARRLPAPSPATSGHRFGVPEPREIPRFREMSRSRLAASVSGELTTSICSIVELWRIYKYGTGRAMRGKQWCSAAFAPTPAPCDVRGDRAGNRICAQVGYRASRRMPLGQAREMSTGTANAKSR